MPTISDSDVEEVLDAVRSGWLTSGPRSLQLEDGIANALGNSSALAVSSGTAAMHVALTALKIRPGTAIVTTPMTFCSTAHLIEQVGCRPLFVDVEPDTLNIDPGAVEAILSRDADDIGAILPVHYAGHPVEMDRLLATARAHGIPVVEDAAHAFGAKFRGTPIGRITDAENDRATAFSLYATKNITSGEGGILTAAASVLSDARLWSLHGMSRDSWQRYGPRGAWDYAVVLPGFKYNLSDINAALGVAQLRRWASLQERRTKIATQYTELLATVDEVQTPVSRTHVTHAWHLYPIRLDLSKVSIDRSEFIDRLRARNIGTSVHFIPVHTHPYYRDRYGFTGAEFRATMHAFDRLISLPIYPQMNDGDVEDVVAAVRATIVETSKAVA
ncbi:MAG: DegT/DnrJ/EryC1/StrS family aminotransferase [Actinomycetia bacterium]|nr:DegT/DnrJ/EryC1/StrS family aminotransferase [Actinomycetes bacterium]